MPENKRWCERCPRREHPAQQRGDGLEDAVHLEKGVLAPSNAAMVEKARGIIESLGGQIATARQAREMLSLPS